MVMTGFRLERLALPMVLIGAACLCQSAHGQLKIDWEKEFGSGPGLPGFADGVSLTSDGVYTVGGIDIPLPGPSSPGSNAFVRKYDLTGNVLWTHQFSSSYGTAYGV